MPWPNEHWPPEVADALDAEGVFEALRAALSEREALVPSGDVPTEFARWDALRGTPHGAAGDPLQTAANLQYAVARMLGLAWPVRFWDPNREDLYALATLCEDAFGAAGWTWDLTETGGGGQPVRPWTPPFATLLDELYRAVNRMDQVRLLPSWTATVTRDSVHRLTDGITDWATERAVTFGLFDGDDDGQQVGLAFDVGLGGEVLDDGADQTWRLESRGVEFTFATAALAGAEVAGAWLHFTTAAPDGDADFEAAFTAEVANPGGAPLATFASDDLGPKRVLLPAEAVDANDDTVLVLRSGRPDTDDRPAWDPAGPNYTSTYREGLAVGGPVRLIVEVAFEYHG